MLLKAYFIVLLCDFFWCVFEFTLSYFYFFVFCGFILVKSILFFYCCSIIVVPIFPTVALPCCPHPTTQSISTPLSLTMGPLYMLLDLTLPLLSICLLIQMFLITLFFPPHNLFVKESWWFVLQFPVFWILPITHPW